MYDASDLDAIQTLIHSAGYRILRQRELDTIERLRNDLERPVPVQATAELRGRISGLRLALDLPNILQAEIEADLKES